MKDGVENDEGPRGLRVACLTFFDPAAPEDTGLLRHPYGIEELEALGFALVHVPVDWSRRRPLRDVEAIGQLLRYSNDVDVVFAMFESQANAAALARALHIPGSRRVPLVVLSCWLGEQVLNAGATRRRLLRHSYRSVDRLLFLSSNQQEIFETHLGMHPSHLSPVAFGVDFRWFSSVDVADNGYLVSVGRDRGRDWQTLFDAIRDLDVEVRIACRAAEIEGLDVPEGVVVEGFVSRDRYRELLAGASAVVLPTHVRAYPTGQSVALEAMSMGKCVIATDTPAMADYLDDNVTAILTPPGDAGALRSTMLETVRRPELRRQIGAAAQQEVETRFTSQHMWRAVAETLTAEAAATRRP